MKMHLEGHCGFQEAIQEESFNHQDEKLLHKLLTGSWSWQLRYSVLL